MTNFEKITMSPETLGGFLAALPVATGPWDESFRQTFCADCKSENCDAENCRHQDERNNPTWWLMQRVGPDTHLPIDGICNAFNVYLGRKEQEGKLLRNIKSVILPTISVGKHGSLETADVKLVFSGCEDAAEIINRMGEKCTLEIRAAVQCLSRTAQVEYHGHQYIFEAVPMGLEQDQLEIRGTTGLIVSLLVHRYTATVEGTKLWDFEWVTQKQELHDNAKKLENVIRKSLDSAGRDRRVF